jgi:phosphate transport system permease protein
MTTIDTSYEQEGTVLPARAAVTDSPAPRRRLSGTTREDRLNILGAAASSFAMTALLFGMLAPINGAFGFAVVFYTLFLVVYALLVRLTESGPTVRDRIATVAMASAAAVTLAALVFIIVFTLWRGKEALVHLNFFTQDMSKAGPLDPVTVGGVKHAVLGTLWMIGLALLITVPSGITAAVYLNEIGGRFSRLVRTVVDAMTALPSIVAGLFIYALWILALGQEKSALAASLAISLMMLPIIIRAADVVLRLVPGSLREASAAMGASQWRTTWHVVLPTARSGLATAVILGTARGIGETAPVLLTAGFTAFLNTNPVHGPMVSLPLAAFEFIKSPQPAMIARGFATAALLMVVVLVLFVIGRLIGGRGAGQLSPRQARRAARRSARDLARIDALTASDPQPEAPEWEAPPEGLLGLEGTS